ncbi:MAG: hypothetical protein OQK04_07760 [Kangiellaceae bacterium]|nr:hypothetical protein [Kangiellaceae bacterium]MCW8998595.1 hypothetical protein [Kangiellaceae bacterium]
MKLSVLKPLIAMGASLVMCAGLFLTHSLDVNAHIKHQEAVAISDLDNLEKAHFLVGAKRFSLQDLSPENQSKIRSAASSLKSLNLLFGERNLRLENKLQSLEHTINQLEEKSLDWTVQLNNHSIHLTEQEFEHLNTALDKNSKAIEAATLEIEKTLHHMRHKSHEKISAIEAIATQKRRLNTILVKIAEKD